MKIVSKAKAMIAAETIDLLLKFRKDRDWEQFHSVRNLIAALCVEASELLEHFVWISDDQVNATATERASAISDEIADIAILLSYLAHDLSIDIDSAIKQKIARNALKYPIDKARGSNKKYTDL